MGIHIWPTFLKSLEKVWLKNTLPTYNLDALLTQSNQTVAYIELQPTQLNLKLLMAKIIWRHFLTYLWNQCFGTINKRRVWQKISCFWHNSLWQYSMFTMENYKYPKLQHEKNVELKIQFFYVNEIRGISWKINFAKINLFIATCFFFQNIFVTSIM